MICYKESKEPVPIHNAIFYLPSIGILSINSERLFLSAKETTGPDKHILSFRT